MGKLNETLSSLSKSYAPIETKALEHYPSLSKEKAINQYLEDIDKMKLDNKKLKDEQVKYLEQLSALKIKTAEQENTQRIFKEYTTVASWDQEGNIDNGSSVIVSGPLSGWLDKYVTKKDNVTSWQCNPTALANYKAIIEKYPKYPFSYLYISVCLKKAKDNSWKGYANKGMELFNKTIIIPNHSQSHDDGMLKLKKVMEN